MRVSVLGVGAIGSVVAAALATTDVELHLHVRGERGAAQMLQGVAVSGHRTLNIAAARFLFRVKNSHLTTVCFRVQTS